MWWVDVEALVRCFCVRGHDGWLAAHMPCPPGRGRGGGGCLIGRDFEQVPGDLTAERDLTGLRCCFGNCIGLHSPRSQNPDERRTEAVVALQHDSMSGSYHSLPRMRCGLCTAGSHPHPSYPAGGGSGGPPRRSQGRHRMIPLAAHVRRHVPLACMGATSRSGCASFGMRLRPAGPVEGCHQPVERLVALLLCRHRMTLRGGCREHSRAVLSRNLPGGIRSPSCCCIRASCPRHKGGAGGKGGEQGGRGGTHWEGAAQRRPRGGTRSWRSWWAAA